MNLTQRHLALFEAIARLNSLTMAAQEQTISQSAASQSLKEMEKQLGYALFQKTGRQLRLTEAGQGALPRVRQVLAGLESLKYPNEGFIGGPLVVAASETIASYLLPQLLQDFVQLYPKVEPVLDIQNTEAVVYSIEHGKARIGFIEGPAHSSLVQVHHWRDDHLTVFAGPDFIRSDSAQLLKSELATAPWIVRESGSGTRAVFDQAFHQLGLSPYIKLSLPRQEAIKQSARAGLGIGCLSELAIADELAAGLLVSLDTALNLKRTFSMVQHKQTPESALVERFKNFAQQWQPH
jgi:DNA-binding transcriptional LysR family regulator